MPEPLSVDSHSGVARRPQADKIKNGANVYFEGVNLQEGSIRGNRGRLKQNLKAITDLGKNGLFYYENSTGQRELVYCDSSSINNLYINPICTGFFSYSTAVELATGRAMFVDASGNTFILPTGTSTIKKYDKDGTLSATLTIPSSYIGNSIAVDDAGFIYVTATLGLGYRLYKLTSTGTQVTVVSLLSQRLHMTIKQGYLYIPYGVDLEYYNTSDLTIAGTITGTATENLKDLDFGTDGFVYAIWTDNTNYGVKKIDTAGTMTKITASTTTNINGSLKLDEFNRIWIATPASVGSKSILVYKTDGTLLDNLFVAAADNTDFFSTGTVHLCSYDNEIILHDYTAANFMGVKHFLFTKN